MKVIKCCGTWGSVLAVVVLTPTAHAETRATLDVSAGARVAANPYLNAGSSTDAVAATMEVSPSLQSGNARSTFRLDGSARFDRYFRRYGNDVSGRFGASLDQQFSEQTRLSLSGLFSTSMGGSRDLIRTAIGVGLPGTSTGGTASGTSQFVGFDPTADVTVTGARFRQYNYGGNARLSSRVSSRGQVSLGGGVNVFEVSGTIGQPYTQYVADAGYNHILDDRSQIGLQGAYSKIDYANRSAGGGDVITPAITGTFKLSSTLSLTGSAGVAFASIRQINGTRGNSTALAAQISLCSQRPRSALCISGGRNVQATSLGGVSTVTTVSVSQNWQFSERDSLVLSGNYGQTDQATASAAQFGANRAKLATAVAVYSRRLSERLYLTVSPQFEKAWGQAIARDANYGAMVGLRYRFGR